MRTLFRHDPFGVLVFRVKLLTALKLYLEEYVLSALLTKQYLAAPRGAPCLIMSFGWFAEFNTTGSAILRDK